MRSLFLSMIKSFMKHFFLICLLVTLAVGLAGCELISFASFIAVGDNPTQKVHAQYKEMENKRFAVLVAADEYTLYQSPEAASAICQAVTRQLATNIPSARPVDPRQVIAFQEQNPYWTTSPYGPLLKRLNVDRLIIIDLVQYNMHDKGNSHVWRGVAVANVSVAEAEADDPNNLTFSTTVKTVYPPDTSIGVLQAEESSFRMGLLGQFTTTVANLFSDHTAAKK